MNIKELKNRRNKLKEKISQKLANPGKSNYDNVDPNSWYPKLDENGYGQAVIRFLLPAEGMDLPWIEHYSHAFKGPTDKWYFNNCPTSVGGECPLCKANQELWKTEIEANRKIASSRKRKLLYHANVLIVNDPSQPELNGTVKVFKFGPQIFNIIQEAAEEDPLDPDYVPVDAFCPWDGSDFVLKVGKDDRGYTTYKKSTFKAPKKLGTDAKIEEVMSQALNLQELYLGEDQFKSYDELQKDLDRALGETASSPAPTQTASAPTAGKTASAQTGATASAAQEQAEDLDELDALFEGDES